MLHKHLQAHIVRKDRLPASRSSPIRVARHVRRRRVQLAQQEPRLTSTLIANDVSRDGQTVFQQLLGVRDGGFEQFFEILVSLLFLIARFAPLSDSLAVENEDVEECVEKEDDVGSDRDRVEEDRMSFSVESVGHQSGLDHDQGVVDIGVVHHVAACKVQPGPLCRRAQ